MSKQTSNELTKSNYRIYKNNNLKDGYKKMLNDNLEHLISYLYSSNGPTDPELRAGLSLHMILSSGNLVSITNSIKISKDLNDLLKNTEYLAKFDNPKIKRSYLRKELETLRAHTELDDTMSLNSINLDRNDNETNTFGTFGTIKNYDITTGISTLNELPYDMEKEGGCIIS
jgi:hypothetical protein